VTVADPSPTPRFWPWAVVWAALFAVAHTQSPDYYSNQHQYYLHGFAQAGVGHLDQDWLANTKDPTPAYSRFVAATYRHAGPWAFQAIYFVLLGVYFEAVRRLVGALPGFPSGGPARLLFLTLFVAAHAAILRVASVRLTGVDYPWFLQAGVAAQYLLGPGFQPSAFGVLLIASLAAYVLNRPVLASVLAAATAAMHTTYLLPAGFLTLGYVVVALREGRVLRGLIGGLLALAIVAPVIWYTYDTFTAENHDQYLEAQWVLVNERIPHHAVVERWWDAVAGVQCGLMVVALWLVRNTRLFPVLAIATSGCVTLTLVQLRVNSPTLALIFPWRLSAVLMPIATAIILGKAAMLVAGRASGPSRAPARLSWASGAVGAALAAGGVAVYGLGLGYFTNDAELGLLNHVRDQKKPGDVYLLPVKFPTLKKEVPASQSKTFAPPVRVGAVGIPVDLQRFRLWTGAPIYVDFKAPPYATEEVFEWKRRMKECEKWYAQRDWDSPEIWREVKLAGITHVVATADKDVTSAALQEVYRDESYRLYRIRTD
jgi:hypothetical protein